MTAGTGTDPDGAHLDWPRPSGALNRPRRAPLAAVELVVAGLLGWLAVWLWDRGVVVIAPVDGEPGLAFTRYEGNWIGGSVAVATVALLLVLDAPRQLALASRVRRGERVRR